MSGATGMRGWIALGLGLAVGMGCVPPPREVERPRPVAAPAVAARPVVQPMAVPVQPIAAVVERVPALLEPAHGDGLIVSNKDGLVLLDAGLRQLKVLSRERGRHLRIADGQLYYFELKQPRLRALDLTTGATRAVAVLPKLHNDCFEGGRPADPIAYVQGAADVMVTAATLCIDVSDQPGSVVTETVNFRVDLKTGAVEQRKVLFFSGEVCGEGRRIEEARLCTPTPEPGARQHSSPSGRWRLTTDLRRGEKGEQNYALVVLTEQASGREVMIVGRKLRTLKQGAEAPIDACMITDKARVTWLGRSDVLLIEGCRDRLSAVLADGTVEFRQVDDFVPVPAR